MSAPAVDRVAVKESAKCHICLGMLIKPVTFPCKHEVCFDCYSETMEKSNLNCPFCRTRLSVWSRRNVKSLINESRWNDICVQYPHHVRRALATAANPAGDHRIGGSGNAIADFRDENPGPSQDEEDVTFESELDQIVRVLAAPGEVRKELEHFALQEKQMRQREREREEEKSLSYIRTHFSEENEIMTRRREQVAQDEALAHALQQDLDEEAERQKKETNATIIRRSSRRRSRTPAEARAAAESGVGQEVETRSPSAGCPAEVLDKSQEKKCKRRRSEHEPTDDSVRLCKYAQTGEQVGDRIRVIDVLIDHSYAISETLLHYMAVSDPPHLRITREPEPVLSSHM